MTKKNKFTKIIDELSNPMMNEYDGWEKSLINAYYNGTRTYEKYKELTIKNIIQLLNHGIW